MKPNVINSSTSSTYYCIGVDIGGTHTDAILLKNQTLLATAKVNTTSDTTQGVNHAIKDLFKSVAISPCLINALVIGTTHFVNAVLQTKGLNEVMVIRLAKPATTALPPMADWPTKLCATIGTITEIIAGGHEYHGKEIAPLDVTRLAELAHLARAKSIKAAAITGVFAHVNPAHEITAQKILNEIYPELQVSVSHLIGGLNLLPRENATILNAALSAQFNKFYNCLKQAMLELNLNNTTLFFSSNDGTLEHPQDIFPIATYNSGTSNSISGAALLTGQTDAIVADIGGTSTDVGILKNGFPVEAGYAINIGNELEGITCNFPTPLTRSRGLGGGSKIVLQSAGAVTVGPESVGYQLNKEAIIFGGDTLTVTDIAVAKGRLKLGHAEYLTKIDPHLIQQADQIIHIKLAEMVKQMLYFTKSTKPIPLILVGGGACLFDQQQLLEILDHKISAVQIPANAGHANALGAACAKISGTFNGVFQYADMPAAPGTPRQQAIALAQQHAIAHAVAKGAAPDTVTLQELDEIPINYLPGNQTRLHIKVIGNRANTIK
jgi:N-methylhydantoinase A/oxoprolinase/acetone carboxylase beta subunit